MLRARLLLALLTFAALGCDGSETTIGLDGDSPPDLVVGMTTADAPDRFLACPVDTTRSVTRTLGPQGGLMELDGHRFVLPVGAVVLPTTFTLTVPASEYVEVEIHAEGYDRFYFALPASVTMSYDRCQDTDIDHNDLSVWHIGGAVDLLLEHMGGSTAPHRREITFATGHLSGFIIAN